MRVSTAYFQALRALSASAGRASATREHSHNQCATPQLWKTRGDDTPEALNLKPRALQATPTPLAVTACYRPRAARRPARHRWGRRAWRRGREASRSLGIRRRRRLRAPPPPPPAHRSTPPGLCAISPQYRLQGACDPWRRFLQMSEGSDPRWRPNMGCGAICFSTPSCTSPWRKTCSTLSGRPTHSRRSRLWSPNSAPPKNKQVLLNSQKTCGRPQPKFSQTQSRFGQNCQNDWSTPTQTKPS